MRGRQARQRVGSLSGGPAVPAAPTTGQPLPALRPVTGRRPAPSRRQERPPSLAAIRATASGRTERPGPVPAVRMERKVGRGRPRACQLTRGQCKHRSADAPYVRRRKCSPVRDPEIVRTLSGPAPPLPDSSTPSCPRHRTGAPPIAVRGLSRFTWELAALLIRTATPGRPTSSRQHINRHLRQVTGANVAAFTNTFMSQGSFGNLCGTSNRRSVVLRHV